MTRHRLLLLAAMFMTILAAMRSAGPVPVHADPLVHTNRLLQETDATLRIVNASDQTICGVFVSPVTATDWGDNWLDEGEAIFSGRTHSINLPPGTYDVGLADCDGKVLLAEGSIIVADLYELRFTGLDPCMTLNQDGIVLYNQARYAEALEQFREVLDCSRGIGDRAGEGRSLNNIGFIYSRLAQYEQALDNYQQALVIVQEIGDREGEGGSLNNIAGIYASLGQYEQALEYYRQALAIAQEIGDRELEGATLHNFGDIYDSLGQYNQALEYFQQALAIAQDIGDRGGEGVSLNSIGGIYSHLGQYEQALDYCQQALAIAKESGDRAGEGISLNSIGFIYSRKGQYKQALENYQQALDIAQESGDRKEEGTSLNNIGAIYSRLGKYEQALDYNKRALAIAQEIGDREGRAASLNNIGAIYSRLGKYEQALDYYQQALTIQREIGDREGEGGSLNNVGDIYHSLGQYEQALDYSQQALAIQHEIGDREGEAVSLTNIGVLYSRLGQYELALDYCRQALAVQGEIGDRTGEGTSLNNIGGIYSSLGQYEQALENIQQALVIQQEIGDRSGEGTGLNNIGAIHSHLGRNEQALDYYQQALAIKKEIGDRSGEGANLNNIGFIYSRVGQYEQALEYHQQALAIRQEISDRSGEGVSLNNIGLVYSGLGQYERALDYFQQARGIAHEIGDQTGEGTSLNNIGLTYDSLEQYPQALDYYRQAIDVIESIVGEVKVEEFKASLAGEQGTTYALLIGLLQDQGQSEEAFAYAERARARAFLDQMGNQQVDLRQGAAPELIQQEQELRQRIVGLQNALSAEQTKPFDQQSEELLTQLNAELEKARGDHEKLRERLKLENPEYASLVSVSTLSLEEVQKQVLDQDTTLIEYFVLDDRVLAWVIDQEGFELVALEMARDDLRNQVDFIRNVMLTNREFDAEAAADLYDALFAPLKLHIRHPNLVIVPHGALHYLPFAALWDAEHQRYLVQDYAVTYAPSASTLKFILDKRSPDQGRLLAMGNPDGSLPYAEDEAEAVAGLYGTAPLLRQAAVESQVYAEAGEVDVLHLAAHGEYNSHNALYSRIKLVPDATEDGNLEVHEVFGLDLRGANLAVLSACETTLGEQSKGDELVGLARAFLYAGTPAVVTTLWSVDDAASGAEMAAFYRHLQEGLTNAEALRAAQLEVMADERWSEPLYWAAFILTGDYRGNGEPRMAAQGAEEPAATAVPAPTASAVPTATAGPTPAPTRGGPCGGGVALPMGLVLLVGVQRLRRRER